MPRRQILTDRQRSSLFDLPTDSATLLHHDTLADDDLEQILRIPRKMGIDSTASWAAIPRLGQSGRLVHGVRLGLSGQVVSL